MLTERLDSDAVCDWLNVQNLEFGPKPVVFMDNASWHKSQATIQHFQSKGIEFLFNLPCRPELNPIEYYFSEVKWYFKKRRLEMIAYGEKPDLTVLVTESLEKVKKVRIQEYIEHSHAKLLRRHQLAQHAGL